MADHKAEQILDRVTTLLTGLATTGSNVARDQDYDLGSTIANALSIYQGADVPVPDQEENWQYIDSLLDIRIRLQTKLSSSTPVSQQLNQIRKEIAVAIQTDPTLALSFVIDTDEGVAQEPILGYAEKPIAVQDCIYSVLYRRSRTDPSA